MEDGDSVIYMKEVIFYSPTLERRYWSHVEQRGVDECWPWTASGNKGYGRIHVGYDADGRPLMDYAHRVGWKLTHGESPGDLDVRHRCDNPCCQNPAHWELGTHTDNMHDMNERGRAVYVRGDKHGKSKLTTDDVKQIRALYKSGHTQAAIAKMFPVSQANISLIVRGEAWQHVGAG